jgi:hypothetical protein
MRAHEFITETRKIAKISKRMQQSTRGLQKFRDPSGIDRTYELNRVMMAAACSDGVTPLVLDAESWSGRYNTAHPYTEIEQQMLTQVFKALGTDYTDLNGGNFHSEELESTNIQSPVTSFKGYKRR